MNDEEYNKLVNHLEVMKKYSSQSEFIRLAVDEKIKRERQDDIKDYVKELEAKLYKYQEEMKEQDKKIAKLNKELEELL